MANSKSVNAYTSEGRIQQIEYAMKATYHGTTSLGFVSNNKVYLISEKKLTMKFQIPPPKTSKNIRQHCIIIFRISSDARK